MEELSAAILQHLTRYGQEVAEGTKETIDRTAKDMNHRIKQAVPFRQRTGDYVRSFALKTTEEDAVTKEITWYAKRPQYRLTHLLEKGHYIVKRGRRVSKVRAFPHIRIGEEWAREELPRRIEEMLHGLG